MPLFTYSAKEVIKNTNTIGHFITTTTIIRKKERPTSHLEKMQQN